MSFIGEIFSLLWGVWKEMFKAFWSVFPKAVYLFIWFLGAIIILPCVFVAGNIYPAWVEWGEKF